MAFAKLEQLRNEAYKSSNIYGGAQEENHTKIGKNRNDKMASRYPPLSGPYIPECRVIHGLRLDRTGSITGKNEK